MLYMVKMIVPLFLLTFLKDLGNGFKGWEERVTPRNRHIVQFTVFIVQYSIMHNIQYINVKYVHKFRRINAKFLKEAVSKTRFWTAGLIIDQQHLSRCVAA
jgi:hypothetical protein